MRERKRADMANIVCVLGDPYDRSHQLEVSQQKWGSNQQGLYGGQLYHPETLQAVSLPPPQRALLKLSNR